MSILDAGLKAAPPETHLLNENRVEWGTRAVVTSCDILATSIFKNEQAILTCNLSFFPEEYTAMCRDLELEGDAAGKHGSVELRPQVISE